jgi:phosphohistidine phosphatase
MKLYVLRHGEAVERGDPKVGNDAERPLTAKGIRRTKVLAHVLRQMEISFDLIFSSPLVRARETAEIVGRRLRWRGRIELTDQLAPTGQMEELVRQLNEVRPVPKTILLVGHEPYLSNLISMLCAGGSNLAITLKKGGLCRLDVGELGCARCASLEWLLPPRLLEPKRASRRQPE